MIDWSCVTLMGFPEWIKLMCCILPWYSLPFWIIRTMWKWNLFFIPSKGIQVIIPSSLSKPRGGISETVWTTTIAHLWETAVANNCCSVIKPCLNFATPWTLACQAPQIWGSSSKNTGVGCHFPLQEIFLTQGSNPYPLHWQADSLLMSHQGSLVANTVTH